MKISKALSRQLKIIGRKGGRKTLKKYGKPHYSEAGKKGYVKMKEALAKKLSTGGLVKPLDTI